MVRTISGSECKSSVLCSGDSASVKCSHTVLTAANMPLSGPQYHQSSQGLVRSLTALLLSLCPVFSGGTQGLGTVTFKNLLFISMPLYHFVHHVTYNLFNRQRA
ncbi:hypothetical protein NL108_013362 [Boleophthalmus pectinirostris]|nr:hypothetical protein NL108_013362 [Boleophthalmus pectinirostris]